jgi:hypothetical protein
MKVLHLSNTAKMTQDGNLYSVFSLFPAPVLRVSTSNLEVALRAYEFYNDNPTGNFIA